MTNSRVTGRHLGSGEDRDTAVHVDFITAVGVYVVPDQGRNGLLVRSRRYCAVAAWGCKPKPPKFPAGRFWLVFWLQLSVVQPKNGKFRESIRLCCGVLPSQWATPSIENRKVCRRRKFRRFGLTPPLLSQGICLRPLWENPYSTRPLTTFGGRVVRSEGRLR